MRKPVVFFLLLCMAAGLQACYYDNQEELYPGPSDPCGNPELSKYNSAVRPILEASCYSCHKGANPSGGIHLDTYDAVKAMTANNRLTDALRGINGRTRMPQEPLPPLPECQIKTIEAWVAGGAPNN